MRYCIGCRKAKKLTMKAPCEDLNMLGTKVHKNREQMLRTRRLELDQKWSNPTVKSATHILYLPPSFPALPCSPSRESHIWSLPSLSHSDWGHQSSATVRGNRQIQLDQQRGIVSREIRSINFGLPFRFRQICMLN